MTPHGYEQDGADSTRLAGDGGASAADRDVVYREFRRLAGSRLARAARGPTFQPTDVLHEAWLRLLQADRDPKAVPSEAPSDPERQVALMASAIRSVLIDRIRRREVRRRHAPVVAPAGERPEQGRAHVRSLLALDESLGVLAKIDERAARIVELHVFGGLSLAHAAVLLGVSQPTAERDWRFAKAWLADRLEARRASGGGNREGSAPASA